MPRINTRYKYKNDRIVMINVDFVAKQLGELNSCIITCDDNWFVSRAYYNKSMLDADIGIKFRVMKKYRGTYSLESVEKVPYNGNVIRKRHLYRTVGENCITEVDESVMSKYFEQRAEITFWQEAQQL